MGEGGGADSRARLPPTRLGVEEEGKEGGGTGKRALPAEKAAPPHPPKDAGKEGGVKRALPSEKSGACGRVF